MIIAIGELVYLTTIDIDRYPLSTETVFIERITNTIGNDAPIFSIISSMLGVETKLFSNKISKTDSNLLINLLHKYKVNTNFIEFNAEKTPRTICLREPNGKRTWLVNLNLNFPNFEKINIDFCEYIYFDIYDETLSHFLNFYELNKHHKIKYFLNLSSNSIEKKVQFLSEKGIKNIEVIQISIKKDIEIGKNLAKEISKKSISRLIILTLNSKGAIVYNSTGEYYNEPEKKGNLSTTVGCGSAYSAYFLFGLYKNLNLSELCEFAVNSASQYCLTNKELIEL